MKRVFFLIVFLLSFSVAFSQKTATAASAATAATATSPKEVAATSAKEVAQRFLDKVTAQTLATDFQVTITENASQPTVYKGNIRMRGERFRLSAFGQEAAYDGKTLYQYSGDTDELTLSYPTREELLDANPVLFAKALMKQSQIRFTPNNKKKDVYSIDFIPNNQSAGVSRFILVLRQTDLIPLSITVKEGKKTTQLVFSHTKYDSVAPACTLKKQGAYINDLR